MAIKSNLAVWAPAVENPPYISFNYVESIEGAVEIAVRGHEKKDGTLGDVVIFSLTPAEFRELISDVAKNLQAIRKRKNYGF